MKWDDVEHHQKIETFPDHVRIGEEKISNSKPVNFDKVINLIEEKSNNLNKENL